MDEIGRIIEAPPPVSSEILVGQKIRETKIVQCLDNIKHNSLIRKPKKLSIPKPKKKQYTHLKRSKKKPYNKCDKLRCCCLTYKKIPLYVTKCVKALYKPKKITNRLLLTKAQYLRLLSKPKPNFKVICGEAIKKRRKSVLYPVSNAYVTRLSKPRRAQLLVTYENYQQVLPTAKLESILTQLKGGDDNFQLPCTRFPKKSMKYKTKHAKRKFKKKRSEMCALECLAYKFSIKLTAFLTLHCNRHRNIQTIETIAELIFWMLKSANGICFHDDLNSLDIFMWEYLCTAAHFLICILEIVYCKYETIKKRPPHENFTSTVESKYGTDDHNTSGTSSEDYFPDGDDVIGSYYRETSQQRFLPHYTTSRQEWERKNYIEINNDNKKTGNPKLTKFSHTEKRISSLRKPTFTTQYGLHSGYHDIMVDNDQNKKDGRPVMTKLKQLEHAGITLGKQRFTEKGAPKKLKSQEISLNDKKQTDQRISPNGKQRYSTPDISDTDFTQDEGYRHRKDSRGSKVIADRNDLPKRDLFKSPKHKSPDDVNEKYRKRRSPSESSDDNRHEKRKNIDEKPRKSSEDSNGRYSGKSSSSEYSDNDLRNKHESKPQKKPNDFKVRDHPKLKENYPKDRDKKAPKKTKDDDRSSLPSSSEDELHRKRRDSKVQRLGDRHKQRTSPSSSNELSTKRKSRRKKDPRDTKFQKVSLDEGKLKDHHTPKEHSARDHKQKLLKNTRKHDQEEKSFPDSSDIEYKKQTKDHRDRDTPKRTSSKDKKQKSLKVSGSLSDKKKLMDKRHYDTPLESSSKDRKKTPRKDKLKQKHSSPNLFDVDPLNKRKTGQRNDLQEFPEKKLPDTENAGKKFHKPKQPFSPRKLSNPDKTFTSRSKRSSPREFCPRKSPPLSESILADLEKELSKRPTSDKKSPIPYFTKSKKDFETKKDVIRDQHGRPISDKRKKENSKNKKVESNDESEQLKDNLDQEGNKDDSFELKQEKRGKDQIKPGKEGKYQLSPSRSQMGSKTPPSFTEDADNDLKKDSSPTTSRLTSPDSYNIRHSGSISKSVDDILTEQKEKARDAHKQKKDEPNKSEDGKKDISKIEDKLDKENVDKENLDKDKLEKDQLDKDRIDKKSVMGKLEKDELERDKFEKDELDGEKLEKDKLEKDKFKKAKLEKDKLEMDKLEKDKLEKDKLEKGKLEKDKLENDKLERDKLEKDKLEREKLEKDKLEKGKLEKDKLDKDKLDKDKIGKDKLARDKVDKDKTDKEKADKYKIEEDKIDKKKLDKDQLDKDRIDKKSVMDKLEKDKWERDELEGNKFEKDELDREKLEKDKLEKDKFKKGKLEKDKLEKAKLEKDKLDKAKLEKDNEATDKLDKQKADQNKYNSTDPTEVDYLKKDKDKKYKINEDTSERGKSEQKDDKKSFFREDLFTDDSEDTSKRSEISEKSDTKMEHYQKREDKKKPDDSKPKTDESDDENKESPKFEIPSNKDSTDESEQEIRNILEDKLSRSRSSETTSSNLLERSEQNKTEDDEDDKEIVASSSKHKTLDEDTPPKESIKPIDSQMRRPSIPDYILTKGDDEGIKGLHIPKKKPKVESKHKVYKEDKTIIEENTKFQEKIHVEDDYLTGQDIIKSIEKDKRGGSMSNHQKEKATSENVSQKQSTLSTQHGTNSEKEFVDSKVSPDYLDDVIVLNVKESDSVDSDIMDSGPRKLFVFPQVKQQPTYTARDIRIDQDTRIECPRIKCPPYCKVIRSPCLDYDLNYNKQKSFSSLRKCIIPHVNIMPHGTDRICCASLRAWALWIKDVAESAKVWCHWINTVICDMQRITALMRGEVYNEHGIKRVLTCQDWRNFVQRFDSEIYIWHHYNKHVQNNTERILNYCNCVRVVQYCNLCQQENLQCPSKNADHLYKQLAVALKTTKYWRTWLHAMVIESQSLFDIIEGVYHILVSCKYAPYCPKCTCKRKDRLPQCSTYSIRSYNGNN